MRSARPAITRTISRLYSSEPRRSAEGWASSDANRAASRMVSSSSFLPTRKDSAELALTGIGPALVRPIPACWHTPSDTVITAATPAVA